MLLQNTNSNNKDNHTFQQILLLENMLIGLRKIIGEAVVDRWEKEFREWIEKNKGKHKDIVADKNGVFLKIKDEEEIFEIADSYLEAIAEGNVKKYWETF